MKEIGAFEAKTHFSELLKRVQKGESISITLRGVPVAVLIPLHEKKVSENKSLLEDFYQWRKGISWDKTMNTQKAIKEGRR